MSSLKEAILMVLTIITVLVAGCTSDNDRYLAAFREEGKNPMIEQASTDWGTTTSFEFEVNRTNLTRVAFSLAWHDDSGDGCDDTFEMTVVSADPSAVYQPQQTNQGTSNIDMTVVVNQLPEPVQSDHMSEVELHLKRSTSQKGVGDWKVSITCVNVHTDCSDPKAEDKGNSWVLTVTLYYFEGKVYTKE